MDHIQGLCRYSNQQKKSIPLHYSSGTYKNLNVLPEEITKQLSKEGINADSSESLKLIKHKKIVVVESEIKKAFKLPDNEVSLDERVGNNSGRTCNHYYFCNEFHPDYTKPHPCDFKRVVGAINKVKVDQDDKLNAALLTGESCLLSILPEIIDSYCSIILMADFDYYLLDLQLKRIDLIKKCKEISEEDAFKEAVYAYLSKKGDCGFSYEQYSMDYERHKKNLGEYHPFFSDVRLSNVISSIDKVSIIPVPCNYFCEENIKKLSMILKKHKTIISMFNLSNVMEYGDQFYRMNSYSYKNGSPVCYKYLKNYLPLTKQSICIFSTLGLNPSLHICSNKSFWHDLDHELSRELYYDLNLCLVDNLISSLSTCQHEGSCDLHLGDFKKLLAYSTKNQIKEMERRILELREEIHSQEYLSNEDKALLVGWIDDAIAWANMDEDTI